jgi:hypothetical protein
LDVDDEMRFTVYRPEVLFPGRWASLLVFAHKTSLVVEPGREAVGPLQMEAEADDHFGGAAPRPAVVDAPHVLARGAQLRIVPDLPGIRCNPGQAEVEWGEPVHEVVFRLLAGSDLAGAIVRGAVRVWCGPLILGEAPVTIHIAANTARRADREAPDRAPLRIFINYRREDMPFAASTLYRELRGRFGAENVFFDMATLRPGMAFLEEVTSKSSGTTGAFLALIGPGWLSAMEAHWRLGDDHVSKEIELALRGGWTVIPVLLAGAPLPDRRDLPPAIRALPSNQTARLRQASLDDDIEELVARLDKIAPRAMPDTGSVRAEPVPTERAALAAAPQVREDRRPLPVILPDYRAPRCPEGSAVDATRPGDRVECSVFAPPMVSLRSSFLIQVFAHISGRASEAMLRAREFDADSARRAIKTLESSVSRGTKLAFCLTMPGLRVDDPVQSMVWWGTTESVQFGVSVPEWCRVGGVVGTVTVYQDWMPIGHIKFTLTVAAGLPAVEASPPAISAVGEAAKRYEMAFVSYATADRAKVLERVQVLPMFGVRTFQDVLDLGPGERWEQSLYRHIDESDIVLLFWSKAAKRSKWVRKEVRYALDRKHGDASEPPEIGPVLIEGPPVPRPWKELAHLHFNDRIIYFMNR